MTTKKRPKSRTRPRPAPTLSPLNSSVAKNKKKKKKKKEDKPDENDGGGGERKTRRRNDSRGDGDDGGKRGRNSGRNDESENKSKNRGRAASKRARAASKRAEEAALTERLFGTGDGASGGGGDAYASGLFGASPPAASAAWMDDDDEEEAPGGNAAYASEDIDDGRMKDDAELFAIDRTGEEDDGAELFAIDRSGEDAADEEGGEEEVGDEDSDRDDRASSEDQDGSDESDGEYADEMEGGENPASMKGAAWRDSDSSSDDSSDDDNSERGAKQQKGVSLADGPNRLKKLRRYRDETDPLSLKEYELRLRERFSNTASVAARTDWADVDLARRGGRERGEPRSKRKKGGTGGYASSTDEEESGGEEYEDDDDIARTIMESNASLFATSSSGRPLPPTLLDVVRSRDGNLSDPNESVVSALQFHPGSDEDNPLLMTAGMDKMLRFFRIDEEEDNPKVHGIHFPKMPIACAAFLGDTGSVVLSGRRPFFYVYDALSGKIQRVPGIVGRKERSLERFTVSRDGRFIAFVGNDGYVILVCGRTRQWICDLKTNGSVRAIEFDEEGEHVMASGSDGDVYRWHLGSRRCLERFRNVDGTVTSAIASSGDFLAVGAESGVVNLYDDRRGSSSFSRRAGGVLGLASTERAPVKSIMNLTTAADNLKFNHDGTILAMASKRETNALKLLHVPTATVFSNWPTSKTPLKYVWSTDFSPGSRYLAVGNDHGKCLLYRLKHYWDD